MSGNYKYYRVDIEVRGMFSGGYPDMETTKGMKESYRVAYGSLAEAVAYGERLQKVLIDKGNILGFVESVPPVVAYEDSNQDD